MAVIASLVALLPGRSQIAPLVESDYCYQLIAADRLVAGEGLTSLQPVAPGQPWEWGYDYGFLTQWPAGYSLLVAAVRVATGWATIAACRAIALAACAAALVGWFLWGRRLVPGGVTGSLAATVTAVGAVNVAGLTSPSTDTLLTAALPWVLLAAARAFDRCAPEFLLDRILPEHSEPRASARAVVRPSSPGMRVPSYTSILLWALVGLLAGVLSWIRYAAVFVPAGIGVLAGLAWMRGGLRGRQVLVYAIGAALPIVALVATNRLLAHGTGIQAQLNLGQRVGFDISWTLLAEAWWRLTDLGYYNYKPWLHWVWAAALPLGAVAAAGVLGRRAGTRSAVVPAALSAVVLATCLVMILAATSLFGDKFNFVGLDRYYQPVRPLFVLLCLAPLTAMGGRLGRGAICAALLLAGSWTVQQEWARTYKRWVASERATTPYGAWSRCFEPGAADLYAWLNEQQGPELVVVSNYHEYVALETGVAAIPVPPDEAALRRWLERIRAARGVEAVRVLFVLDPDNRWRDYWMDDPEEVKGRFRLRPADKVPASIGAYVFDYSPSSPSS